MGWDGGTGREWSWARLSGACVRRGTLLSALLWFLRTCASRKHRRALSLRTSCARFEMSIEKKNQKPTNTMQEEANTPASEYDIFFARPGLVARITHFTVEKSESVVQAAKMITAISYSSPGGGGTRAGHDADYLDAGAGSDVCTASDIFFSFCCTIRTVPRARHGTRPRARSSGVRWGDSRGCVSYQAEESPLR